MFAEIEHQIKCRNALILGSGFSTNNLNQTNDIFVIKTLQNTIFSQGCDRKLKNKFFSSIYIEYWLLETYTFFLVFHQNFFQCNELLLCAFIACLEHFSVIENFSFTLVQRRRTSVYLPECSMADFDHFFVFISVLAVREIIVCKVLLFLFF